MQVGAPLFVPWLCVAVRSGCKKLLKVTDFLQLSEKENQSAAVWLVIKVEGGLKICFHNIQYLHLCPSTSVL